MRKTNNYMKLLKLIIQSGLPQDKMLPLLDTLTELHKEYKNAIVKKVREPINIELLTV